MKKVILSCFVMIICLALCGCEFVKKQTLVCTQSPSGVDIKMNVQFNSNVVDSMSLAYSMDLSEYTDDQLASINDNDFCTILKTAMPDYSLAFKNCHQNISDKQLLVESDLDVDKIADGFLDKVGTPVATKEELETEGYTCIIE